MRRLTSKLIPILIAVVAAGCTASGSAYVVETVPTPRHEVEVYRPGFVWIGGHWAHVGSRWTWRDGYYERDRANHIYVQGRWERRGPRYVWAEGGWQSRARVSVRSGRR